MTLKAASRKVLRWFSRLEINLQIVIAILFPTFCILLIVLFDLFFRWVVITTGGVIFLLFDKVHLIVKEFL